MKIKFFAVLSMLFSPLVYAHPGEHHMGLLGSIVHLLSEPDHLAMILIAVVVGVSGAFLYRRRAQVRRQDKRQ